MGSPSIKALYLTVVALLVFARSQSLAAAPAGELAR